VLPRKRLVTDHYSSLGRVYPRTFLRKDYHQKRNLYLITQGAVFEDSSSIIAKSTCLATAKVLIGATKNITCKTVFGCFANNHLSTESSIIGQAIIGVVANNDIKATTALISETKLIASATVVGEAVNSSNLACSSKITAVASVISVQKQKNRIDWENTLGAAPGPVFGWAGGVGGLPPAIAVTFIHGKHIYSDVKRRKKEIVVQCANLVLETNEIKINLVKVSKKTTKSRFEMKANHGKIYALEE
jgi:hypothetical protein